MGPACGPAVASTLSKAPAVPSAFNFTISPFDCLNGEERTLVRNSLDIAYFREGAEVMTPGAHPEHLYVLIKGVVQQWDGEELVASYGPDDSFDPQEPAIPKRVQRGGSFMCSDTYCIGYSVHSRMKGEVSSGTFHTGFRCVKDNR